MSSLTQRGKTWFASVPIRNGGWTWRTTGTRDKAVAKAMSRMIDDLGPRGKRDWEFLSPVVEGSLRLAELYDWYSQGSLDGLRDKLNDVDLEPYVEAWLRVLASNRSQDTRDHYRLYARSLIPGGKRFPRSALTHERLSSWLATREVAGSTKRKYHAALSSFCEYLKAVGVIQQNPMRNVKAPRPGKARMRHLSQPEIDRLIGALPHPHNILSALLHGTGMEVSVALGLKKRDFDIPHRKVRAKGTKTEARDRIAIVAEWAWPMIEKHISLLTPNAPVFPGINRWTASDKHREACKVLGIEDYQLRDSRHSYAVRAIRAGASFEVVARQLGHANTAMAVKVYARHQPSEEDLTKWERMAAFLDRQDAKLGA